MSLADLNDSKFYINIKNELGLDYKRVRGDLLALSLSKPSNNYELRTKVITNITEALVEQTYTMFWQLLRNGKINGTQLDYAPITGSSKPFIPSLPEHSINMFATKAARTIEDICEEAVSLILPDDYLQLSQNRQKDILRSKGMMEENV
jgi:hypothetical protein